MMPSLRATIRAGGAAIALLMLGFLTAGAAPTGESPDVRTIIEKMDRLYRSLTSHGEMEMTMVSENWRRTLRMEVWSEGMDKTFLYITHPRKETGIATLRKGNEMWNYFPKINKVMKVPPSMMMSSWMGSDFTNDDLVKESSMLDDYDYRLVEGPEADLYYIELIPKKETPIVWGKIIIAVTKDDYTPVRHEYFDEKGRKMRVMEFREIRKFGEKNIPSVIELTPLNRKGRKTVVRYLTMEFDMKLPGDVFTLRNLQRRR